MFRFSLATPAACDCIYKQRNGDSEPRSLLLISVLLKTFTKILINAIFAENMTNVD
jgi:hypothetical protein